MRYRALLAALAASVAVFVVTSTASSTVRHRPARTGRAAHALSRRGIKVPMQLLCKANAPMLATIKKHRPASTAGVLNLCRRYHRPIVHRAGAAATQLCEDAGCAYIWLDNLGGQEWAEWEGEAIPYATYGSIVDGVANVTAYTKYNGHWQGWVEAVSNNESGGWYAWNVFQASDGGHHTWVEANMQGWCVLSSGWTAGIGPVTTWNWIT